jgi:tRNA(Arg) A34 adenosine deaminase TadA
VALGAYLSFSLLFVTRVPCVLCFAAHAINLAIALLVWFGPAG